MALKFVSNSIRVAGPLACFLSSQPACAVDVNLTFGPGYAIDYSGLLTRDPARNYYFDLLQPRPGAAPRAYRAVAEVGSNFGAKLIPARVAGKDSLRMQLLSYADGCAHAYTPGCGSKHTRDKIQLAVVDFSAPQPLSLARPSRIYVSYDFKLDRTYEVGQNRYGEGNHPWIIHFQVEQCCYTPSPFAIYVRPAATATENPRSTEVELLFVARDDISYNAYAEHRRRDPRWRPYSYLFGAEVFRMKLPRDQWNNFAFQFEPSYNGDGRLGRITFWRNGVTQFVYNGDWGFKPDPSTPAQTAYRPPSVPLDVERPLIHRLAILLDVYRYPFQTSGQTVYFANVVTRSSP